MREAKVLLEVRDPDGLPFASALNLSFDIFRDIAHIEPPGPIFVGGFDEVVAVMKRKQFRRDVLRQCAQQLADRIADHLEDKEGWHGEERRERNQKRRMPL
jgi:hypothetical protein